MNASHLKLLQPLIHSSKQIPEPIFAQNQETDTKYQNFIYCLANKNKVVYYKDQVHLNYLKAKSEIDALDWTYKNNGISIFNLRNDENIFCSRLETKKWFVQTPVLENKIYTGYQWSSYPDTLMLLDTIRIFFEEESWFETLNWTKIKWECDFSE